MTDERAAKRDAIAELEKYSSARRWFDIRIRASARQECVDIDLYSSDANLYVSGPTIEAAILAALDAAKGDKS